MPGPTFITVINPGAPMTLAGITFQTGRNILHSETVELMRELRILMSDRVHVDYDVQNLGGGSESGMGIVLTLTATGSVV